MFWTTLRHRSAVGEDNSRIQKWAPAYGTNRIEKSTYGRQRRWGAISQHFLSGQRVGPDGGSHTSDLFDPIHGNSDIPYGNSSATNNYPNFCYSGPDYTVVEDGSSATLGGDSTPAVDIPTYIGDMLSPASDAYPANDSTRDSDHDSTLGKHYPLRLSLSGALLQTTHGTMAGDIMLTKPGSMFSRMTKTSKLRWTCCTKRSRRLSMTGSSWRLFKLMAA